MYFVYILYSQRLGTYYKGSTNSIEDRLRRHNAGYELSTSKGVPWELVLVIEKSNRSEAMELERKLKNMNRDKLEAFIKKYGGSSQDA